MSFLFATLVLFLLAGPAPATTQATMIHRCIGDNGGPVFTDQPCAAMHATSVGRPVPGSTRRAPPAPVMLCAANERELKRVVIEAFAEHDANRLAGVMLWGGYGEPAAVADIRALQRFMREPLLGLSTEPAAGADSSADATALNPNRETVPAPEVLVLHTRGNDASGEPSTLRLEVAHRAGCLWLRGAGQALVQNGAG